MRIARITDQEMSPSTRSAVAAYRYQVFVRSLQWQLPCMEGQEQDEFDTASATHLLAYDSDEQLVGYARLLSTTQAYLLATHFVHLLNGSEPPRSPFIWELSRFTARDTWGADLASDTPSQTEVGKRLLLEAIRFVITQGCAQLLFCTTVGIERLAQRWGVDIRRMGPPQRGAQGFLVAATIECNENSIAALTHGKPWAGHRLPFAQPAEPRLRSERDGVLEAVEG